MHVLRYLLSSTSLVPPTWPTLLSCLGTTILSFTPSSAVSLSSGDILKSGLSLCSNPLPGPCHKSPNGPAYQLASVTLDPLSRCLCAPLSILFLMLQHYCLLSVASTRPTLPWHLSSGNFLSVVLFAWPLFSPCTLMLRELEKTSCCPTPLQLPAGDGHGSGVLHSTGHHSVDPGRRGVRPPMQMVSVTPSNPNCRQSALLVSPVLW